MPVPVSAVTGLAPQTKPSQPAVIAIPGTKRLVSRRFAWNRSASVSAYVVHDSKSDIPNTLQVSVKRNERLMALTLKGHNTQIVDLEFLPSSASEPIFVLGSCDTEGVVYLWFLYIAKDPLGIDIGLRMLKKYSFYSLRRSNSAYYSRIRLAGTPEAGTMVLVPNVGSNCRVVNFSCEALQPEDASNVPAIGGTQPIPQLPPPEQRPVQGDKPATQSETTPEAGQVSRSMNAAVASGFAAGAVTAGAVGAAAVASTNDKDGEERVIGEGLQADFGNGDAGQNVSRFEPGTVVEDAEEDEYRDPIEHVIPPAGESDQVYAEGMFEPAGPGYGVPVGGVQEAQEISGEYEQDIGDEEVIGEEVIDDEEELEEREEEEYDEYEEPEVERVYAEGLSNGHEPNYAPPY